MHSRVIVLLLMSMNLGACAAQSSDVYFGLAGSGSEVWQPISEDMISPVLIEEALLEGMRFQDVVRSINSIKKSISGSGTVNNVTIDFFQIDIMKIFLSNLLEVVDRGRSLDIFPARI